MRRRIGPCSCAIGQKACRDNRSVVYHRWPKLYEDLALARGDGRHPRLIKSLGRADLLILDDFGLEPLDAGARHDLLEILEERYGRRSTIVTSQLPVTSWHEIVGDPTYADAILDRLVHNAHRIELVGESLPHTRGEIGLTEIVKEMRQKSTAEAQRRRPGGIIPLQGAASYPN